MIVLHSDWQGRSRATDPALTEYDEEHVITYRRMLDANADGADWRKVSRILTPSGSLIRRGGRSTVTLRAPRDVGDRISAVASAGLGRDHDLE
jgi:hypothetical protein